MNTTQPLPHPPARPTAQSAAVRFEQVGYRYGRGAETLSDVSFALAPGSMSFVTGASGSGKTTLLKLIYLHMRPSRGLISLFGRDIALVPPAGIPALKRRMGIVLQDFHLIDHLSVFENIALPLRITGQKHDTYREDVRGLMKWVGLGEKAHALPPTLSGGEKQRVAIARAVINQPEILIADEPTGNVDKAMAERLMRLFFELNRLGTTVIIATHNHDLIPEAANVLALENAHVRFRPGRQT
ncbi:MAG TPA: ATP-binding cassette domain-containing protein [Hellea balneolensis]|uniref:Cell division ATP-binding protein FtsE n=1 Tax=Hellea balneolensis TaxID=287478 RepID=A0A7V5NWZ0_9PROT|nr:ATP-binding cassette domain-containing protein [Hellea balneolensis]